MFKKIWGTVSHGKSIFTGKLLQEQGAICGFFPEGDNIEVAVLFFKVKSDGPVIIIFLPCVLGVLTI